MGSVSLPLCLILFIITSKIIVADASWDLKNKNAASPTIEDTELGFLEYGQERTVEKVSGEDNVGGDIKVLILDKFRLLLGLHSFKSGRQTSNVAHLRRRHGLSPAPAPVEEVSPAPVPSPARVFRPALLFHRTPSPHSSHIPPLKEGHGHAQARNGSKARTLKIVAAAVVSVATLVIIAFTVALLCHRSRRNQKKRVEKMMFFPGAGGAFGVSSKISNPSTAQHKVSPSPTQELFYLNPPSQFQEEHHASIHKPTSGSKNVTQTKISWSSQSNSGGPMNCDRDSVSYSAEENTCNRDSLSSDDDDDNASFHSVRNSDCSAELSSDASEASLLSPDYNPKVASTQLPLNFSPIPPMTPEPILSSIPVKSKASPSPAKIRFARKTSRAQCSSQDAMTATSCFLNSQTTSSAPSSSNDSKITISSNSSRNPVSYPQHPSGSISPVKTNIPISVQPVSNENVPKPPPPPPPPLPPQILPPSFKQGTNNRTTKQPTRPLPPNLPPPIKLEYNSSKPPPPPPLPPSKPQACEKETNFVQPPVPVGKDGTPLPKLKPLHWDKVRAAPDRSMVWDKIRSNSFELDEEMIESLFSYKLQSSAKMEEAKSKSSSPSKHVLEPKRLQNFTILLKALNATTEQVCDALMRGSGLCAQQLEALVKLAPTKEEEEKLSKYEGDVNELGPAEKFVKAVLSMPFSFLKIEVMLYRETFDDEVAHLRNSLQMLEDACKELRSSRLFMRLLEAVLKTGNRMNVGTIRGGARAFKLDALLRLADVKGTDGKTTLLHFVVQEVIRSEGVSAIETTPQMPSKKTKPKSAEEKEVDYRVEGLELVSGLSNELCNVKKTAGIDLDVLATSVSNLSNGMDKMKHLIEEELVEEGGNCGFVHLMSSFKNQAEVVIRELRDDEDRVLLHVREVTEYFHGNVSKDEANPLRIFVIVRDFLGTLDRVCKELSSSKTNHCLNRVIPF